MRALVLGLAVVSFLLSACGGPANGSGDAGNPVSRCTPASCAGCCDAADVCQLGQTNAACGTSGAACVTCGAGLACTRGACAAAVTGKRVFVTTATYSGNLKQAGNAATGLAGGDALCDASAAALNLGGTWKAWLSATGTRAADRIADVGPWKLLGTDTVIFNNKAGLSTIPLASFGDGVVWTGTLAGGAPGAGCADWTYGSRCLSGCSPDDFAVAGRSATTANSSLTTWTQWDWRDCSELNHLLCFEQ